MPVALVDEGYAVDPMRQRAGRELARIPAEPHRAAEIVDVEQIAQLVNHLVRRVLVDLRRVGALEPAHVARVLHRRPLEAVADAEVRDALRPRVLGGFHHAARAPGAEPAGYENA